MTEYTDLSPQARFAMVDRMASQLFETHRWKAALARKYGITPEAVNKWRSAGAPVWACVSLDDALAAKALETIKQAVREAETPRS
ncbi:hypothetical protein [Phaeobacter gallaeciensis]|uniref:hypothetical protein n=1 Tax=Phaeobacter gallaeciensis TaxID=60890 RepID=UPI00237FA662|nr:hypothetical protein [Phaeobacter gallaeciensis]MDE4189653.1 hypothetical protein [Phaeobacter gallaeciensis]MDE4198805.1 hypothetical protein [Phaeobacter gallaeciensis]MDE4202951.1 hypothetical protein [Phaeobacter gallaeciensis]MDE4207094.1 hypothetical protein [Phaeobacter gallaeciensis]MDE4215681.1 hypothetical protein [Phaeobacter gallaeciensis]